MTYRKRAFTALVAGALALPLLATPANAVPGEDNPPPPRSIAEFCKNVPATYDPFIDDEPNTHSAAIECAAFAEVARGGPGGRPANQYGPRLNVQRDQMASFIARLIDEADEQDCNNTIRPLPATGVDRFTDDEQSIHEPNINRLAAAGIVVGGHNGAPPTTYSPLEPVQRDQMASFILRAIEYMTGDNIESTKDYYTDDERSIHEPNINAVTDLAIAVGERADIYNPFGNIFRDQMASFLTRTLGYLVEAEGIAPAGENCPAPPTDPAPVIQDARVATDAAMATPGGVATDTASAGDVFVIEFSEAVATDGAMATDGAVATDVSITFQDDDGDTFTVVCSGDDTAVTDDEFTEAVCTFSDDGTVLTLELLEDPAFQNDAGNGMAEFPLEIVDIQGFVAADDGQPVDLDASPDTTVESDDAARVDDPNGF